MDPSLLARLGLIAALLCLSAFFSSSETALLSLGPLRARFLRERRPRLGGVVAELLRDPRGLLISTTLGNEFVNVCIAALGCYVLVEALGPRGQWVNVWITAPLLLIVGEILPRTWAVRDPEQVAALVSPPLREFLRWSRPVRVATMWVVDRLCRVRPEPPPELTEREFRELVDEGARLGTVEEAERELVHRILDLGDTPVSRIMTPRDRIFWLPHDLELAEVLRRARSARFSRIPVCRGRLDDVVGVLHVKDLLVARVRGMDRWQTLLRSPCLVSPECSALELLRRLRSRRTHLALVVRRDGRVEGLVTMTDLLEEVFGSLE